MKATLNVQGMTCGHCKMSVEGALNELTGVTNTEVDLVTGKVDVTYDESKVTIEALSEAVEEQGYDVVA
ncbi:copper chaperone CopZ [Oceanobacillus rekensis]|uniref:copper chaperone CopZ n=1 Tax=Oceanobacillus rekensis TaxID=937927 RepID=UPI000B442FED|nr:copper chaperone CopZ [Oceanobacillus rekensis]